MASDAPSRSLLDRARSSLEHAEKLGDLHGDDRLAWAASGQWLGKTQEAYFHHASTMALISIAQSLELVAEHLAMGANPWTD
jgi:hypothetical protein